VARKGLTIMLLAVSIAAVLPAPASALPLILDYTGFSWSVPRYGNPGTFSAVGVIDGFSLPVADPAETYTFYLSGLWLSQVITRSPSVKEYVYTGGNLGIYRSTGLIDRRYSYGANPANGVSPASFVDGVRWLSGGLSSFRYLHNTSLMLATLTAQGSFTSGEFLGSLQERDWFSFAGMTARPGNGIPTGYGFRLDGQETTVIHPVPEPMSLSLLGLGLAATALALRRRRHA
jgi:hypothetical protein